MRLKEGGQGFARRLVGFCQLLRARGLPVGLAEELDLARSLRHVEVLRREDFYLACRTALVKRPEHLTPFDAAFAAFWGSEAGSDEGTSSPERVRALDPFPHPAGDLEAVWGTPAPPARDPGSEGVGTGTFHLMVYSPAAAAGERHLELLSREELARIKRLARRFRRWAATLRGRRYRPSRRGPVDFRRTTRSSLRHGGEWVRIQRRQRKVSRSRLVLLWDVSGSMEGHAPLILGVIYGLLQSVPATQVFTFSTGLEPVTSHLRGRPYRQAVRELPRRLSRAGTGTRIGQCLADFNRRFRGLVDARTTVLVLSDGWDLGDLDLLERELRALRRRCHRLLWVNPYAHRPDFRPEVAGMKRALPHVDLLVPPTAFAERDAYAESFERGRGRGPG